MRDEKGSLTVEAAISFPIFLMVILSVMFFIKTIYVHEIIQHAISETANEVATYSYILNVSGVKEMDDIISEGTRERGRLFNEHLEQVLEAYETLGDSPESIGEAAEVMGQVGEEIYANPKEEVYSFLFSMGGMLHSEVKTKILEYITKILIKKHINPKDASMAHARLKSLNISGGIKDLDFSDSKIFEGNDDIDIIVKYKINLPLPLNVIPDLNIIQRATVKGWLNGY